MAEYAILLFAGLLTFQLLADVAMRAPRIILENQNYVKKVVFPLRILVPVTLGTALFHMGLSLVVLLVANTIVSGGLQWTILLLPVIILPYCFMILGIGWFLAALGVYLRDISEIMAPLITTIMFMSPIFIPSSSLPEWLQPLLKFNPITIPVTEVRNLVIWGELPDLISIGIYTGVAGLIALIGYLFFQKTRTGFADVI